MLARLKHRRDIARRVGAKKSKRAGGGGGEKCKSANAPDVTDAVINPTKRANIEENEDARNRKNRGQRNEGSLAKGSRSHTVRGVKE